MDSIADVTKADKIPKHVQESIEIIEKTLANYPIENTCVSFNGGKDCTAVLNLVHSVSQKIHLNNNGIRLNIFYAQLPNHFKEEFDFVLETVKRYNLKLLQYSERSIKDSLVKLKQDEPQIEAIFIGTRKDDLKPGVSIKSISPTDEDWPKFIRINPILDWTYSQVWKFIRELNIPYCDLYNQGYSSLGTNDNTVRNSSLLRYDKDGTPYYLPAWHLTSSLDERSSRSALQER